MTNEEAQEILKSLGLPAAQFNEMAALTLLALCNLKEQDNWKKATKQSMGVSKDIMNFVNENMTNRMHQTLEKHSEDRFYTNLFKQE